MNFESSTKIEAKSLELEKSELNSYVKLGYFKKYKNREEHVTVHPCWLNDVKGGISAELCSSLGQWNQKLSGYLIGYEKPKLKSTIGAVNEDHKWIHIDICATFYVYQPEVDHQLKGIIQKKGNAAAICTVFNVFTVTVFAADADELNNWSVGDEIEFTIYSFTNRRKGPILRARTTGTGYDLKHVKVKIEVEENWEIESPAKDKKTDVYDETEVSPSKKKKKKRDKLTGEAYPLEEDYSVRRKIKLEEESFEDIGESSESSPKKAKKKKRKKDKVQEYE